MDIRTQIATLLEADSQKLANRSAVDNLVKSFRAGLNKEKEKLKDLTGEDDTSAVDRVALEKEALGDESTSTSLPPLLRPSGSELLKTGLDKQEILGKLSICLAEQFKPDNPLFKAGIKQVIQFYTDLVNSFNQHQLIGRVAEAVAEIEDKHAADVIKVPGKANKNPAAEITNTIRNNTKPIPLYDYSQMTIDLTNLAIATNIVNYKRLLEYSYIDSSLSSSAKGENQSLYALRDIFKISPRTTKSSRDIRHSFVSNLSDSVIGPFFASKNQFAVYLSKFNWGSPTGVVSESIMPGDVGNGDSFTDRFVLHVFISYIVNIIENLKIDPAFIFKLANEKAIKESIQGSTYDLGSSTDSMEDKVEGDPNWAPKGAEGADSQYDGEDTAYFSGEGEAGEGPAGVFDTTAVSEDLADVIEFNSHIVELKKENNWTDANNLAWLQSALRTSDNASGLSTILAQVFSAFPTTPGSTVLGKSFDCYKIAGHLIEYTNLLATFKNLAGGNTLIDTVATLLEELKSADINVEDVRDLIEGLPKTESEAIASFDITSGSPYTVVYKNEDAKTINSIYNSLTSLPVFMRLSPSVATSVPPEGLVPASELQSFLGVSIIPTTKKAVAETGMSNRDVDRGVVALRSSDKELVWAAYMKALKEILTPTTINNWGLLQPTVLSPKGPSDIDAAVGIVYPTELLPVGSTVKLGRTRKLAHIFNTPGEYTAVASRLLLTVESRKASFFACKSLDEIKGILASIISTVFKSPQEYKLLYFSSPETQTCLPAKRSSLYKLLDPKGVSATVLTKVDKTKQFSTEPSPTNNAFVDLASTLIVENNKAGSVQEGTTLGSHILKLLSEDTAEQPVGKDYTKVACDVAINTQVRARILLALVNLMDVIEALLVILRKITSQLRLVLVGMLGENDLGPARKLFSKLAEVLIHVLRENPSSSQLEEMIKATIEPLNTRYKESEKLLVTNLTGHSDQLDNVPVRKFGSAHTKA